MVLNQLFSRVQQLMTVAQSKPKELEITMEFTFLDGGEGKLLIRELINKLFFKKIHNSG